MCVDLICHLRSLGLTFDAGRGRKGLLRKRLRGSQNYEVRSCSPHSHRLADHSDQEWKDAARTLDDYLGFDEWKQADEDPFYDWRLLKKVCLSIYFSRAMLK
jgi:hypothetical protein